MTYLIITTKLLLLLSVPSTYANQNKTSSSSEDVSIKEDWIENISPTINNLLVGFDCQNPTEVDSFELESVEQCEDRIQNSKTKEAYVQILQESDEYPLTARMCKLTRTKKVSFCGASDHDTSLYDKGFTYRKTRVHVSDCKQIHRDRYIWKNNQRTPIELNQNTYLSMYIKGKQYPSSQWDGNQLKCQGEVTRIDNIDISHGIEYEEDEWLIQETTLVTDGNKMKDVNNNRLLNCKPEKEKCFFNEETYFWNHDEPKCKYYELKKVKGIFTFIDGVRYFTANDSLIHLRIDKDPVKACGQKIFGTDFEKIFISNLKYQEPIGNSIKAESLSLMRDYAIRDSWIFNRLTQMLRSTVSDLARKHCRDNSLSHTNWLRILTSYKLNTMTPFSLNPDSEKFMMPIGENLVVYKCSRKLVKPRNLNNGKCYKHLPISTLNREFIAQSNNNNSSPLFLTPHSRVITNVGVELPCSNKFSSKYKTYTNNWISYTQDGIQETIPPKMLSWSEEIKINFKHNINQSFGIDKGIYDFNTINKFDELQVFTGERESILSTITRNLKQDGSEERKIVDGQINIENAFPSFPWNKIKNQILSSFEKFGTFCSIGIGIWTIINLIKNFMFNCINCLMIRQVSEGMVNSLLLLTNPSTYLIRKMKKKSENTKQDNQTKEENIPLSTEVSSSRVIIELRLLNEKLPSYKA